jgi:hypothetical protein
VDRPDAIKIMATASSPLLKPIRAPQAPPPRAAAPPSPFAHTPSATPSSSSSLCCLRTRPFSSVPLAEFADYELRDSVTRRPVRLAALCAERPVAIVFLRRLGCQLCRLRAAEVEAARLSVDQAGAFIVCVTFEYVGEGSDSDNSWARAGVWGGALLTDPTRELYRTLFRRMGLCDGYGFFTMSRERVEESVAQGFDEGANFKGDGLMLGGVVVIDRSADGGRSLGAVRLDHRSEFFGDDVPVAEILEALEASVAASGGGGGGGGGGGAAKVVPLLPAKRAEGSPKRKKMAKKRREKGALVAKACATPACAM